jgi:hypothetical protein
MGDLTFMKPIRSKETYNRLAKHAGITAAVSFALFVALFYSCVELSSHKRLYHSSTHPNFDWIAIFCDLALLATVICTAVYLAAVILKRFAPKGVA